MANQRACVNIPKHRNLELLKVFFRDLLRTPVGADSGKLAHNQALDIGPCGLGIFGIRAVVTNFGISENYDLASVGRVGENFLIAGDGSIKNYFAVTFAFGSVAFAAEDSAIFQRKDSLHSRSKEWILEILAGKLNSGQGNLCNLGFVMKRSSGPVPSCPWASTRRPPCRKYSSGRQGRSR